MQQARKKKGIRKSLGSRSALMSEGVNLKWPAVSTLWFIFKSEVAFSSIIIIKNYSTNSTLSILNFPSKAGILTVYTIFM